MPSATKKVINNLSAAEQEFSEGGRGANLPPVHPVMRPRGRQEIFELLFETANISISMTTERDIRNQIRYAEKKGLEKGLIHRHLFCGFCREL